MLPLLLPRPRRSAGGHAGRAAAFAACVAMWLLAARPAGAQQRGVVAGTVRAADEARLAGARVELVANAAGPSGDEGVAVTEGDGAFRFEGVPDGTARLVVRRLGFRPETLSVAVPQADGGGVVVTLRRVAQPLAAVVVRERAAGPLPNGFERRRASGFGHYITRADIARRNPLRTTDLLRDIAGVTISAGGPRFRAAGGSGACAPSYFFNGSPAATAIDLDAILPDNLESLEVYSGAATVPAALRSALAPGGCGAIVVWTRTGDAPVEYADESNSLGADSLARRVEAGWAYTADQVDLQANPLPGQGAAPEYPDALRKERVAGRVLAEFVVDEQGRVDPTSVNIVSSTHPLLSAAVRAAVERARFAPAYAKGRVVRQVVQLPVVFEPTAAAAGGQLR